MSWKKNFFDTGKIFRKAVIDVCLGSLAARTDLNIVLYPNFCAYGVMSRELESDVFEKDLDGAYDIAVRFVWDRGRKGVPMSEWLAIEALELWTNCRTYRQMQTNIGIDPGDISQAMVELLGGERWTSSMGDIFYKGWCEETYQPTKLWLAQFHIKFELIHPLFDGNGRWGRLINCFYYGRWNQRPTLLTDRETYLRAMRTQDVNLLASLL